jgi:hypothetical protein
VPDAANNGYLPVGWVRVAISGGDVYLPAWAEL